MNWQRIYVFVGLLFVLLLIKYGCSGDSGLPPLGYVTGTVTLGGQPLTGAIIAFYPENGRMGTALIDEQGKYEIKYTAAVPGTNLGPNSVHFAWPTGQSGPSIPERYGDQSELKVHVKKGNNTFDFALESDSPKKTSAEEPPQNETDEPAAKKPEIPILD